MKFLAIILFLLSINLLMGQSVTKSEEYFSAITRQINAEQAKLDSLKLVLEKQAVQIDLEKTRAIPNKKKVTKLMSQGLPITGQIEIQQNRLSELRVTLNQLKVQLAQEYSAIIDSLQVLENTKSFKGNRQILQQQIISFTEKYLLFSPAFRTLTFDPKKIQQINLNTIQDSLERVFSIDFLQNALQDIDSHLAHIKGNRKNVETTIRLEEKTREFLEEVDEEYFGLLTQTTELGSEQSSVQTFGTLNGDETQFSENADRISEQTNTIAIFFNQLDLPNRETPGSFSEIALDSGRVSLSLEEYLTLLKAAEKRLTHFHSLVSKKLQEK